MSKEKERLQGVYVHGQYMGEEDLKPFKMNNGEVGQNKKVAVLDGIETIAVEVPKDEKIIIDENGDCHIKVVATAYCGSCKKWLKTNLKQKIRY